MRSSDVLHPSPASIPVSPPSPPRMATPLHPAYGLHLSHALDPPFMHACLLRASRLMSISFLSATLLPADLQGPPCSCDVMAV